MKELNQFEEEVGVKIDDSFAREIIDGIIVKDNFITDAECEEIIGYYDSHSNGISLDPNTDNKIDLHDDAHLCRDIVNRVIKLIEETYSDNIIIDMAALFARTVGNKCELHCDNLIKDCPLHGTNQELLREVECDCPNAEYKPNHTGWRLYTALLYLDSNHKGGEIIFQDGPVSNLYRKWISSEAGRLVLTPDNRYYYHETTPVSQGVRYSMNMWFKK